MRSPLLKESNLKKRFFQVPGVGIPALLVWLGVFVSALSVVKIMNTYLQFGFSGIWGDILSYYTDLTQPLRELFELLPFLSDFPSWAPDVFLLYVLLFAVGFRATMIPLFDEEFFAVENIRGTRDEVFPRLDGEDHKDLLDREPKVRDGEYASIGQGKHEFTVRFIVREKPIVTYIRQLLKCIVLWPIYTLEPYRKLYFPLSDYVRVVVPLDEDHTSFEFVGSLAKAIVPLRTIKIETIKLNGVLQIVSLPVMVALFFVLAVYFP